MGRGCTSVLCLWFCPCLRANTEAVQVFVRVGIVSIGVGFISIYDEISSLLGLSRFCCGGIGSASEK